MRKLVVALACHFVVMVHYVNYLLQENVANNTVFYAVKRCLKRFGVSKKPGAPTPDE